MIVDDDIGVNSAYLIYSINGNEFGMEAMEAIDKKNWNLVLSIPTNGTSLNYSFLVTDDNGNLLLTRSKTISIADDDGPVAIAAYDTEIWEGNYAKLDASGSTDNIEIVKYEWIIEDHDGVNKIEGVSRSYTFQIPGIYRVTLRVEDATGSWDNETFNVIVKEFPPGVEVFPIKRANWCMILSVIIGICIICAIFISVVLKKRRKVKFLIKKTSSVDTTTKDKALIVKKAAKTIRRGTRKREKPVTGKSKRMKELK